MFFVYKVFVLSILHLANVNSFLLDPKIHRDGNKLTGNEKSFKFQDGTHTNGSSFSTYKPFFEIVQNNNHTTTANLKSNEFDKMLSDEMFAIKQLIYEKEKTNVPLPTLLVKKRWKVVDLMSKLNKAEFSDEDDSDSSSIKTNASSDDVFEHDNLNESPLATVDDIDIDKTNLGPSIAFREDRTTTTENVLKQKVIGLRSLYDENDPQDSHKKCGCKKKLSKSCTECTKTTTDDNTSTDMTCSHSSIPTFPTDVSEISASAAAAYVATTSCTTCFPYYSTAAPQNVYYSYSPYYVPYPFYIDQPLQPDDAPPIRKEKKYRKDRTKPPRRLTVKRTKSYYYYEDDSKENTDDYLENSDSVPNEKYQTEKNDHVSVSCTAKGSMTPQELMLQANNCKKGECTRGSYENERNNFVNRVVNDLKTAYGDAVMKPCFCDKRNNACSFSFHIVCVVFSFLLCLLV